MSIATENRVVSTVTYGFQLCNRKLFCLHEMDVSREQSILKDITSDAHSIRCHVNEESKLRAVSGLVKG